MNATYVVCIICLAVVVTLGQNTTSSKISSAQTKADDGVILSVQLLESKKCEINYVIELRNNSPAAIFYPAKTQQVDGEYGPYVSLDNNDDSVVNLQWRVFHRDIVLSIESFSNDTGVELKRLGPGESVQETASIKWPLIETVPPILKKALRNRIDRKNVKGFRFTVGYFEEDEGILEFLTRKPFGWFIKGHETLYTGVFRGKRFYEIQRLLSTEVTMPENNDK